MSVVIGWDVGGAHLKAARAENGRITAAVQVASPLRLGLPRLTQSFREAKAVVGTAGRHAVTMTGELADTFSSRTDGVERLVAQAVGELAPGMVSIYAGRAGFVRPQDVGCHVEDIASANWFATASLAAKTCGSALVMDMGSTTTDIVAVHAGRIAARGYTDAQRLAAGELIYTGLVRGYIMATARQAPVGGRWMPLINENFANMADVHRILGSLPEGADQMNTTDSREKTVTASRARLARMVGRDAADASEADWTLLARWFAEAQIRAIADGAMLVLSRLDLPNGAPIVGAGIGATVLREIARRLERQYISFAALLEAEANVADAAAWCAPAAAVALLASASSPSEIP